MGNATEAWGVLQRMSIAGVPPEAQIYDVVAVHLARQEGPGM